MGLHAEVLGQGLVLVWRTVQSSQLQGPGSQEEGVKTVGWHGDVTSVDVVDEADKILVADVRQYQDSVLQISTLIYKLRQTD